MKPAACNPQYAITSRIPTFRDFGGQSSRYGGRVATGLVYRAGHFVDASALDKAFVDELRLPQVLDLRSAWETRRTPNRWVTAESTLLELDIIMDVGIRHDGTSHLTHEYDTLAGAREMMLTMYRNFPRQMEHQLPHIVSALLDGAGLPTMIHCSAGKDRTGFACAILLKALGVNDEEIMADYLRAGESLVGTPIADEMAAALHALIGRPIAADAMAAIMSARREYLETSLRTIDEHYAGIDRYLQRAGLNDQVQERLRERFLTGS